MEPRYRMLDEVGIVGGCVRRRGEEFTHEGWPKGAKLEPINSAARKIAAYYEKHRSDPFLPASPFNKGVFYLPALTTSPVPGYAPNSVYGEHLPTPVPDEDAHVGMPRYTARHDQRIGKRDVKAGEKVYCLHWPDSASLTPANAIASTVAEYFARQAGDERLPGSPWCEFSEGVVLPDLSAEHAA